MCIEFQEGKSIVLVMPCIIQIQNVCKKLYRRKIEMQKSHCDNSKIISSMTNPTMALRKR